MLISGTDFHGNKMTRPSHTHISIYTCLHSQPPEALHKTPPATETCVTSSHNNRRRTPRCFSQPFRKVSNQQQPTVHTHTSAATTGPRSMTVTSPGTHPSTGTPHPGYSAELHPTPSSSIALYLCARVCVTCMPLLLPYTWLAVEGACNATRQSPFKIKTE